jgi:ADP-heptose:LPS heptosyltransferase
MRAGAATEPAQWRNGLILSHSHIGDVLYRTCSLNALACGLPRCTWSYLVTPQGAELLLGNDSLHATLPFLHERSGHLQQEAIRELSRLHFDAVLCTNTFEIGSDLLLALRLRIPNRSAFTFKGWRGLVSHPAAISFPSPYPSYFQQMVTGLVGRDADWPLRPVVRWTDADRTLASRALRHLGIEGRFLICAPATRQPGAAPPELFMRVLRAIRAASDIPVLLIGAPPDWTLLQTISAAVDGHAAVLTVDLNLRALTFIFSQAAVAFTQDSGPRHLANAAGTPVLFLRNLLVPRVETGVYCAGETDLSPDDELLAPAAAVAVHRRTDARAAANTLLRLVHSRASVQS